MWIQNTNNDSLINKWKSRENFVSTGCPRLDSFLSGGLPQRGITQIYGESGTGKTQLALQLCLSSQIPSENSSDYHGGAAYISTDAAFPSKRLQELSVKSPIAKKYNIDYEKIFIEHVCDTKDLEDCIFNPGRLQYLLSKHNVKLLIIDSIAAPYRYDTESSNVINRAKSLRKIGYQLQKLANTYGLAIVCINQVTAIIKNSSGQSSNEEQPSLGITWASMITNSLYMYKKNSQRYLHIAGSPYLSNKTIEYEIFDTGIVTKGN